MEVLLLLGLVGGFLYLFVIAPEKGAALVEQIKALIGRGGAALIALGLMAVPAMAQQCGPRDQLVEFLRDKHSETQVSTGAVGTDGTAVEVFAKQDGATWTMFVSRPDGIACLITSGETWRNKTIGKSA